MNTSFLHRRGWLSASAALLAASSLPAWASSANKPASPSASNALPAIEVWKDPNCGCCKDWITQMQQAGFAVSVHDSGNTGVRAKLGLPQRLGSCHTALVAGYLLEGHVPASDVQKLLQQKPKALGLAVPGMPVGSPGMDGPEYGGRKDAYDVLLVTKNLMNSDVSTSVFSSYR